ncbi:MAG: flagellar motor switch protein FliN [Armatimonadota bacterium]
MRKNAKAADEQQVPLETDNVELEVVDSEPSASPEGNSSSVKSARFAPLESIGTGGATNTMDILLDVQLELSVELGRASMPVREVLQLGPGAVVELNKLGGEPVDILVNGRPIARGEVVVVDENFGVRVTEIINRGNAAVSL